MNILLKLQAKCYDFKQISSMTDHKNSQISNICIFGTTDSIFIKSVSFCSNGFAL